MLETRQRTADDETLCFYFMLGRHFRQQVLFPQLFFAASNKKKKDWSNSFFFFLSKIQAAVRFNEIFKTKLNKTENNVRHVHLIFVSFSS